MPHKKLESRVLNVRQTIIYNFSLNVQKHWYPGRVNGSFDNLPKTIHDSHKLKLTDYCIKLSTRVSFLICLPFFRLVSIVYQHLATKKNTGIFYLICNRRKQGSRRDNDYPRSRFRYAAFLQV